MTMHTLSCIKLGNIPEKSLTQASVLAARTITTARDHEQRGKQQTVKTRNHREAV